MNVESYRRRAALDRRKKGPGRPAKIATEKTPPRTDTHLGVDPAAPTLAPCGRRHPSRRAALCSTPPGPQSLHSGIAPIDHADAPRQSCVCRAATINETRALPIPYRPAIMRPPLAPGISP